MVVSVSLETLKTTLMVELTTTISLLESGTAEANVHSSSSSFAEAVAVCERPEVGAASPPPNRSIVPDADADAGGFTDC